MKKITGNKTGALVLIDFLFIVLLIAALAFGAARFLLLSQSGAEKIYLRVLLETLPALLLLSAAWIGIAAVLKRRVKTPAKQLEKEIAELSKDVSEGRQRTPESRGALCALSEELNVQRQELIRLVALTERETERETELSVRRSVGREIYQCVVPSEVSFEGAGFGIEGRLDNFEGADFLDGFLLDSRTVFFAVGDIWARGLPAAMTALKLKNELRAGAFSGKPIGQIVLELNDILLNFGEVVSLFVGIFRSDTGELRFVNMGHFPPVVTGMYSDYLQMNASVPLGAYSDITVREESISIAPGQGFIFYTEGVFEAKDRDGRRFGYDRLFSASCAYMGHSLAAEGILHAVGEFGKDAKRDDAAVLVLQYHSVPSREVSFSAAAEDQRQDGASIYRALSRRVRNGR